MWGITENLILRFTLKTIPKEFSYNNLQPSFPKPTCFLCIPLPLILNFAVLFYTNKSHSHANHYPRPKNFCVYPE